MNVMTTTSSALARLTDAQERTLKQTIAIDCNADEFDLYMSVVRNTGLDAFRRQVIPIIFGKREKDPAKRRMSIVVTQDGLRTLAARAGGYGAARAEPAFECDEKLIGPTNPLGIVKCTTTLWKQDKYPPHGWTEVNGWAYWSEYAPIRQEAESYDWIDTGETWEDTGKPKKKKVARGEVKATLDSSGLWAKMPRVMIAKCATMQALRAGWPDTFGSLYSEEEIERGRTDEFSASERVERAETERRQKHVGMLNDEYAYSDDHGVGSEIPAGQFADHVIKEARKYTSKDQLDLMRSRNRIYLRRFWATHKDDALQLNAELEKIASTLASAKQKEEIKV